jgi:exodeoxyribonuclease VII large subunit
MSSVSVSQLLDGVKSTLEGEFANVHVVGEISNLSKSTAGHWYFTLSDEDASVSCALFRMDALRNPLIQRIKDGEKIEITGPISVYKKRGTFQVIVRRLKPHGQGNLALQFEKLKQKLMQQGLFKDEHKKSIPRYPQKIAVITAPRGAALQDFLNIIERRSHWFGITVIPAIVQGDDSPRSLIRALKNAQQLGDIDLIVLTRGGGSMEDLWSFNDEALAHEIFNCEIPIISAVGHQVDFTLCDFVADHRCETPSAAAEFISQPQVEIKRNMRLLGQRLVSTIERRYFRARQRLSELSPEILKSSLKDSMNLAEQALSQFDPQRLGYAVEKSIDVRKNELERLNMSRRFYELTRAHEHHMTMDEQLNRLKHSVSLSLKESDAKLNTFSKVLKSLDPNNVLERGYSYITSNSGQVVQDAIEFKRLPSDEKLQIHFADGTGNVLKE